MYETLKFIIHLCYLYFAGVLGNEHFHVQLHKRRTKTQRLHLITPLKPSCGVGGCSPHLEKIESALIAFCSVHKSELVPNESSKGAEGNSFASLVEFEFKTSEEIWKIRLQTFGS